MIAENRISGNSIIGATRNAYTFGREDALAGIDQRGSAYFPICGTAWHAYNAGYTEGCALVEILTGQVQPYWMVAP